MRIVTAFSYLVVLSATSVVVAQQDGSTAAIDPAFIEYASDGIDYPGCFSDLATADRNGDGVVRKNEYLDFIQTYGKRICHTTDRLSLEQVSAFTSLACLCQGYEGFGQDCCLGDNARIFTNGALNPDRTQDELRNLVAVCRVTDGVIYQPRGCPPKVDKPEVAPPPIIVPLDPGAAAAADGGGLSKGAIAGIVIGAIAALLLLLCCCCFAGKRRKARQLEEEEIAKTVEERPEQALEQAPGDIEKAVVEEETVPGMMDAAVMAPVIGSGVPVVPPPKEEEEDLEAGQGTKEPKEEDEEEVQGGQGAGGDVSDEEEIQGGQGTSGNDSDEEDMVKGRGSANIPPEEEDASKRPRYSGELPPEDTDHEKIKLRPPPEKEPEEDPEWDQPGRLIEEPKEKVEDEAQVLEPYVPDGGVHIPVRPQKEPLDWKNNWERGEVEDPDENDDRKHRIQAGLGEGEVWDKLGEKEEETGEGTGGDNGAFDWVVQHALGVLNKSEGTGMNYNPDADGAEETADENADG